jgi:hypothetical protein
MELAEALPILQRWYAPRGVSLRICRDHICDRDHPSEECRYPDSAKYTATDALHDTAGSLEHRITRGWAAEAFPALAAILYPYTRNGSNFKRLAP